MQQATVLPSEARAAAAAGRQETASGEDGNHRVDSQFMSHIPFMQAGPPQRLSAGVGHASGTELADCAANLE